MAQKPTVFAGHEVVVCHDDFASTENLVDNNTTSAIALNPSHFDERVVTKELVRFYLAGVVNPVLCLLGIIGNTFNILVLTRRRMKAILKWSVEQSGHEGLIALAVSDTLCCAVGILEVGTSEMRSVYSREAAPWMYAQMYGPGIQNALVRTSAWLTVITAVGRYAVICRPMEVRRLRVGGVLATRLAITVTIIVSVLLELPTVWAYEVHEIR